MFDSSKFEGRTYSDGDCDCYGLSRRYIAERWGVRLPNFARCAEMLTTKDHNPFYRWRELGFEPVMAERLEIGDVLLMSIASPHYDHCGIVIENNGFLHHLWGRLSKIDRLYPKWGGRALLVLRHPEIHKQVTGGVETVHLHEVIDADVLRNPEFQEVLERAVDLND